MPAVDLKTSLAPVFARHPEVLFALLFGSAAGESGPLSDIDLAIYVADPAGFTFNDKLGFHADCCRALRRDDLDLVVLNQTRNLILQEEIIRTGILLWDKEPEVRLDYELKICHLAIDFKYQRRMEMGV